MTLALGSYLLLICFTQQDHIEKSSLQKWMFPVVDPVISCINKTFIAPVEDSPVFEHSVDKRLDALFGTLFPLVGLVQNSVVASMTVCQTLAV